MRRRYRTWAVQNKKKIKGYYLKRVYGITHEAIADLLRQQGDVCAICGGGPTTRKGFHIDHDHQTGEIRGLLCHRCNTELEVVESGRYEKMVQYLQRGGATITRTETRMEGKP